MPKGEQGSKYNLLERGEVMRIDIIISVLSKETNQLKAALEEYELKNSIGKLLYEKGYKKFVVAGSDVLSDKIKDKIVLD